jgi:voltage-gated potassium channel
VIQPKLEVALPDDAAASLGPVRDRINLFFHRYDLPATIIMATLALLYVGLGLAEDQRTSLLSQAVADTLLNVITAIFATEFIVRLYGARSRLDYLKHHWIDILAVLPSLRFLRLLGLARLALVLRLLRIVRLGLIAHSLIEANRAAGQVRWIGKQSGVHTLLLVAFGFVWVGAGLAYEFEHGVNPQFATLGDSVWWAFSTMATLGYLSGPITIPGRVVAALLMVVGIACLGLVTGTVTNFIRHRTERVQEYSSGDLMQAIKEMQQRMSALENKITGENS